ncbi:hypothetical protein A9Q98_05255 [Thalassotalea sp. 42_200_T64]|nr:hypothetical protein A9Q98_05255 [Thalassotalea sp. 42_200_T64]
MRKIHGFTLIEVLVSILILTILASVAAPSFLQSFSDKKLVSASEELYSNLQLARSEALTRSVPIYWSAASLGTKNWQFGMSAGEYCDPKVTSNVTAKACVLTIDDGDGQFSAANDLVLHRIDGSEFDDITLKRTHSTSSVDAITFDPARGTTSVKMRYYTLTSALGREVNFTLSMIGNIKICSDDITNYKDCG